MRHQNPRMDRVIQSLMAFLVLIAGADTSESEIFPLRLLALVVI